MSEPAAARTCYRHPDRETGLSCSVCERPICTDCATFAAVGIRCPEHSGAPQGVARTTQRVRRSRAAGDPILLTKILVGVNVAVFLLLLATGGSLSDPAGELYVDGALLVSGSTGTELVGLAHGEWWRLLTSAFLHAGIVHLGMNMLALWWFGGPVETALGRARFLLLYLVSALAGSAGALLLSPEAITVGASGAVFGILGAALVLERGGTYVFGGGALGIIVLNLAFTLLIPNISIGGHLGGLAGGRWGRSPCRASAAATPPTGGWAPSAWRASSRSACSASRSRTCRSAATPEAAPYSVSARSSGSTSAVTPSTPSTSTGVPDAISSPSSR